MGNADSTRHHLLDAAYKAFVHKGVARTGIQEIADSAGLNKAMLYYYFDSKEDLFLEVFKKAVAESGLPVLKILEEDTPLLDKIRRFIGAFIQHLLKDPLVSSFALNELNRNPEQLSALLMEEMEYHSQKLKEQIEEAADRYEIARIDPRQLVANMVALCLGPVINREFYMMMLDIESEEEYSRFLKDREGIVYDMIVSWLTT